METNHCALSGLRVIDFGQYIAGPLTAMMLADFGANVIHIDPPGGPRMDDPINAVLMRGKQNIVLNLKKADDVATAKKLIASADIVIENFRPGIMERLGLGAKESLKANPGLIYCSIPGFSSKDSRASLPGWEGIVTTESGLYTASRYESEPGAPTFTSLPVASIFASVTAAHSIVAALIYAERTGEGQIIEAPLYDACFEACGIFGQTPKRKGEMNRPPRSNMGPLSGYACKDGRFLQLSPPMRGIRSFWEYLVGEEEDPEKLKALLPDIFKQHTMLEWEKIAQEQCHTGAAPILTSKEWMHDAFALESASVVEISDPVLGETAQPGPAVFMAKTPANTSRPRTMPDADRVRILAEIDSEAEKRQHRPKKSASGASKQVLGGVKILDLCQVLAGPIGARILSEYGAQVIKINNPRTNENPTAMAGHDSVNCGKMTTYLDLKSEDGRALFNELLREADVFHCNFTQEVFKKLKLDEASIRRINPNIIFSQVNVHSVGGSRSTYRGHEELGEAISGIEERFGGSLSGKALPLTLCDNSTGCFSALGVMLALYHRERTGEAQHVQVALSRSANYLQIPFMIDFAGKDWSLEPRGFGIPGWSPLSRFYRTENGWFFLEASHSAEKLGAVHGLEDIDLSSASLEKLLEERFNKGTAAEWVQKLEASGIPARVNRDFCAEAMLEPYAVENGLSLLREHRGIGETRVTGCSRRLSATPTKPAFAVAAPGLDTELIKEKKWNWEKPEE